MYSTASPNTFSTICKVLVIAMLLMLVGETISVPVGQPYTVNISVSGLKIEHEIVVASNPWYLDYVTVYIVLSDSDGDYVNITMYFCEIQDNSYTYIVTSSGEEETIASIPDHIVISSYAVHVGTRTYMHYVNISNAVLDISWDGEGEGELILKLDTLYEGIIPENPIGAPDPFSTIGSFFTFLGYTWQSLIAFFNIIIATINIVWSIILLVFEYVGLILAVINTYVLPNLVLFIGIYFFATLAMAVADMRKHGFQALINWGRIWYGHIMALIKFIETLAHWGRKLISLIIQIIDAITPFT